MHVAWRCSGGDNKQVRAEKARDGEKKRREKERKKERKKKALH
jgi:hypothetical protein